MVYQNNNNRITPNATEDRNLKPAATAQNKLVQYQPDLTRANAWKGNAQALASIGQGLMDIDTMWRIQSQENAIKAIWETEAAGGNKKDWREVSRNIKGAAKFNPYNDDAYRFLQAQDIYRAVALELSSTPDLEKLDPEKYYQLVNDTNKKMIEAFKQTGLSPKDYGHSLVQWDSNMKTLEGKYIDKHAEYKFKRTQVKIASNASLRIDNTLTERTEDMSKGACIKNVLLETDAEMASLGWSKDTRIGVHFAAIKGYLSKHANEITLSDLKEALDDLEIDGEKVETIIPEYNTQIKQLYREAQKAIYEDRAFDLQMKKLEENINSENAMVDYMKWVQDNPNASVDDEYNKYWELVKQYGVEGSGALSLLNQVHSTKQGILGLRTAQSDPKAVEDLEWKLATGNLTLDDFVEAKAGGLISGHDAAIIYTKWETDKKSTKNMNDKAAKEINTAFEEEYLMPTKNGKGTYYIKDKADRNKAQKEALGYYEQYKQAVASGADPNKAYEEFKENMRKHREGIKIKQEFDDKNIGFTAMISPKISDAQYAQVNAEADLTAFKRMGLVRYKGVSDKSIKISSGAAPQRTITYSDGTTKVNQRHTGTDVGSTLGGLKGRLVYPPMNGQVVYVQNLGSAGNVVIVKCDNGKYMKVMHLDNQHLPKIDQRVLKNDVIGMVGSTGNVANKAAGSLHVEFYDKNQQWIAPNRFYK